MSPQLTRPIAIDAGHGWHNTAPDVYDPGARNKDLKLAEASLVAALAVGVEINLRDTWRLPTLRIFDRPLRERSRVANAAQVVCFVSLHLNCCSSRGTETYHYPGSTEGKRLASLVLQEIIPATTFRNRGVKEARYAVLAQTSMPATLLEVCFIDSAEDAAHFTEHATKIARAIARGIVRYLAGATP